MRVIVTIQSGHDPGEVADRLRAAGMQVEQTLPEIGVVSGDAPDSAVEALKNVNGVAGVEPEQGFQLPPPDSPVQ